MFRLPIFNFLLSLNRHKLYLELLFLQYKLKMKTNSFILKLILVVSALTCISIASNIVFAQDAEKSSISKSTLTNSPSKFTVIAHRGASGHLPEHTIAAKVLAYGQGAHYLEQDLVMTKDNQLIVHHDLTLDATTNVAMIFPTKARADGHFYVIDFTLDELRQLSVHERKKDTGEMKYPARFNNSVTPFHLHTFEEELALIKSLNKTTGRNVGIYPEIKSPWFHHQHDKDISLVVLKALKTSGYLNKEDNVYVQSFDSNELQRIKRTLLPSLGMDIKLVQLIAYNDWQETKEKVNEQWHNYDYNWMFEVNGASKIANYADGIGPWFPMLVDDNLSPSTLLSDAKKAGLAIHPYTFRLEDTPQQFESFEKWLRYFTGTLGIDGVFTDQPDRAISLLLQNM